MKHLRTLLISFAFGGLVSAQPAARPATAATAQVVAKAKDFLASLDDAQRAKVLFKFDDAAQKVRWSNFPSPMFQRAGLQFKDMTPPQRTAAHALLSATFSKMGYEKVLAIMEGDQVLAEGGQAPPPGQGQGQDGQAKGKGKGKGGGGGGGLMFGKDLFYFGILGTPSLTEPWILQFGGHHLALNITVVGDHDILTPSLTAAQPAIYERNGKTVKPLGAENDKAFTLFESLTEAQKKQAVLGFEIRDLVLGPGQDGKTIQPEGIKGSALNAKQQVMLMDIASEWTGIINDAAAAARMAEIKSTIADTWFAWSGATERNKAAYFRIQGPTLVIEYAPQAMGGDATMHIHTIYRDPTNDYAKKWIKQ